MLKTKRVGDEYKMLVTVSANLVTNIPYLFTLATGTNIQKMSSLSKFCHHHPKIVTNINSPKSWCHHIRIRKDNQFYFWPTSFRTYTVQVNVSPGGVSQYEFACMTLYALDFRKLIWFLEFNKHAEFKQLWYQYKLARYIRRNVDWKLISWFWNWLERLLADCL